MATPLILRAPPTFLDNGDLMSQAEFHIVYEKTPEHFKAELIGGVVYVASPLRPRFISLAVGDVAANTSATEREKGQHM